MNFHNYDLNYIKRILKLAYSCNVRNANPNHHDEKKDDLDRIALQKLKAIVNQEDQSPEAILKSIAVYNGFRFASTSSNESISPKHKYIGVVEWFVLCCVVMHHGTLLNQKDMESHSAWLLFINDLNKNQNVDESAEKTWFNFMNRLIKNGQKESVKLIHNYLFLVQKLSLLNDRNGSFKDFFIELAAIALVEGLELDGIVSPELMMKVITHLLQNKLFESLFKGYPTIKTNEKEFKHTSEIVLKTLWDKEVVNIMLSQLPKDKIAPNVLPVEEKQPELLESKPADTSVVIENKPAEANSEMVISKSRTLKDKIVVLHSFKFDSKDSPLLMENVSSAIAEKENSFSSSEGRSPRNMLSKSAEVSASSYEQESKLDLSAPLTSMKRAISEENPTEFNEMESLSNLLAGVTNLNLNTEEGDIVIRESNTYTPRSDKSDFTASRSDKSSSTPRSDNSDSAKSASSEAPAPSSVMRKKLKRFKAGNE